MPPVAPVLPSSMVKDNEAQRGQTTTRRQAVDNTGDHG
jgi:hypothetical protein